MSTGKQFLNGHPYVVIFLLALVVRVLVVLATGSLEDWALDDTTYLLLATQAAEHKTYLWDPYSVLLYEKTLAFMGPLTLIFRIFGSSQLVGQLYVAVVGAALAPVITRIARERLMLSEAIAAGLIVALLPSQVIWSSFLMKDSSVWLMLGVTCLLLLKFTTGSRVQYVSLVGLSIAMLLLGHLREHTLVVTAIAMLICGFAGLRWWGWRVSVPLIVIAVLIPWLTGLGPAGVTLATNAGSLQARRLANAEAAESAFIPLRRAEDEQNEEAYATLEESVRELQSAIDETEEKEEALSGELRRINSAPPAERDKVQMRIRDIRRERRVLAARLEEHQDRAEEFLERDAARAGEEEKDASGTILNPDIRHLPKGIFVMLFEPTPWGWASRDSAALKAARLESILWYPLLALATFGLPCMWRQRRTFAFAGITGFGVLLLYALTEGNIGTAYRHRGEFVWVVALLASLGIARYVERRSSQE